MTLTKVQIELFRNILDSTEVAIQDDVTCLVGKNESGKTAFLKALRRLNPAQGKQELKTGRHYPAWLEKKHRRQRKDLDAVEAVKAWFILDDKDKSALSELLGDSVLVSDEIIVSRTYGGRTCYRWAYDEAQAVNNLFDPAKLPPNVAAAVAETKSFQALREVIANLENSEDESENVLASQLVQKIDAYLDGNENFPQLVEAKLGSLVPKFFYFAEYSKLPGIVRIRELLKADDDDLDDGKRTAKSLLMLAGAEDEYLLAPEYEERKRELENVANSITVDVLKYWTTNPDLRVEIDISKTTESTSHGHTAVIDELHFRMRDDRHMLSLPFEERSSGFQWFFSFLAAFSEYEDSQEPVVILLDEPGVGLHARAQADFLRFIDERLAQRCQVIYTTHSPFMIQPGKLERARVIEDHGPEIGAVISNNVLATDPDTLFPLQGALGYDLAQHLFIGPDNLVVEGTSDFTYLSVLSDYLTERKKDGLDDRWTITPVGGADLVPTFVALLGRKNLDFTVLVDSRKGGHQKLQSLADQGFLVNNRIITIDQVLGQQLGDIEDLFSEDDYLKLYNEAFGKTLKTSDLSGSDPLVRRIARKEQVDRFDHGKPAEVLLRHRDKFLPTLSDVTLKNFESIFSIINKTLRG